jgi:uncharacterized protein YecE (DUF72 family)
MTINSVGGRSGSKPGELAGAERISNLDPPRRKERDVYVYFDNTAAGHASRNALRLRELIDET